jgi:hypothetical protein
MSNACTLIMWGFNATFINILYENQLEEHEKETMSGSNCFPRSLPTGWWAPGWKTANGKTNSTPPISRHTTCPPATSLLSRKAKWNGIPTGNRIRGIDTHVGVAGTPMLMCPIHQRWCVTPIILWLQHGAVHGILAESRLPGHERYAEHIHRKTRKHVTP